MFNNDLKKLNINLINTKDSILVPFQNKIVLEKLNAIEIFKAKFGKNIKDVLNNQDINLEKSKSVLNPKDKSLEELIKNS